jgi:hypothetical protein
MGFEMLLYACGAIGDYGFTTSVGHEYIRRAVRHYENIDIGNELLIDYNVEHICQTIIYIGGTCKKESDFFSLECLSADC